MRKRLAVLVVLVGSLVAALAVSAPGVLAGNGLSCGQAVTGHVVLHHDIGPCPGDGLVVVADNTTVYLNGHTVFSDGAPAVPGENGIENLGAFDNVVIKGPGVIRGFYDGIRIDEVGDDLPENNRVIAVKLLDSVDDGLNADRVGRGFLLRSSTSVGSGDAGFDVDSDTSADTPGIVIANNVARSSGGHGFDIEDLDDEVIVRHNRSINSGRHGYRIERGENGSFIKNLAKNSGENGFRVFTDVNGLLVGNVALGSGQTSAAAGFFIVRLTDTTTFVKNVSKRSSGDGFFFEVRSGQTPDDNVMMGNVAVRNGHNGFAEPNGSSGTTTYRHNIAIKNTGYGILAPNGVASSVANLVFGNGMGCSPGLSCFPQN